MRSLFTLLVIAIFFAAAFRHQFAALLLYWWFGIFRPHEWMWWDLSALRLPLIAALIFLAPPILRGDYPSTKGAIPKCLLILAFLGVASAVTAGCDFPNPVSTSTLLTITVVTLFSSIFLRSISNIICFLAFVGVCLLFHSGKTGLLALFQGQSLYSAIIGSGSFSGSNAMALGSAMAIFCLVPLIQLVAGSKSRSTFTYMAGRPFLSWSVVAGLSIFIAGGIAFIALSGSRGSSLALGLGVLLWLVLHPKRISLILFGFFAVTLMISIFGMPQGWIDRIDTAFVDQSELDNSAASRPHFWRAATEMVSEHPLGVGVGCYKSYYSQFDTSNGEYGDFRSVHSSHFAILAELGYLGLLVWAFVLVSALQQLLAIRKYYMPGRDGGTGCWATVCITNALLALLVVFVFGGSFYEMPYNDFTWITFSSIIALNSLHRVHSL